MTNLYEQDFALWSEKMADLIANGRFDELDIINLVEEIRDLSKRERDRLLSSMGLILHHLLKWDYQLLLLKIVFDILLLFDQRCAIALSNYIVHKCDRLLFLFVLSG